MTDRPENSRGKRERWIVVAASAALVLANSHRVGISLWGAAVVIAASAGGGLLVRRVLLGDLSRLDCREALSQTVSRSSGFRRRSLVWYEYVIARDVQRGTYAGEPPAHFKSDVYEASMSMSLGTRAAQRQALWTLGAISVVFAGIAAWVGRSDLETGLVIASMFAIIVAFSAAVTFGVIWYASRKPRSRLGRRVEDASSLPTEQRWQTLLQIAREEIALQSLA